MKTRKWYDCYKIKPKRYSNEYDEYIVMTDMGYIFSATWEKIDCRTIHCGFFKDYDLEILELKPSINYKLIERKCEN